MSERECERERERARERKEVLQRQCGNDAIEHGRLVDAATMQRSRLFSQMSHPGLGAWGGWGGRERRGVEA